MGKIQNFVDLTTIKDPTEYMRHSSQAISNTAEQVNGGLQFDSNLATKTVSVTFPTANTDVQVTHNLGRIPSGYLKGKSSANISVFDGSKADTLNVSYVQASAPGTVTLIFY